MLANLATSLFEHGKITTTEAKAKRLRPLAERLITFAKRGVLHTRRQVMTVVRGKDVVHALFAEIGPRFAQRPGGYTRIVKTGPRKGDNAPMAVIELVEGLTVAQEAVGEAERARGTKFAAGAGAAAASGEVTADVVEAAESTDAAQPAESADEVEQAEAGSNVSPETADEAPGAEAEADTATGSDAADDVVATDAESPGDDETPDAAR